MFVERRKFLRFDVPLGVEFNTSRPERYLLGVTINFSRGGLCIELQKCDLAIHDTMTLKVQRPQTDAYVAILGKIVWKKAIKNRCWFGLEIQDMDKEAKSEILDYAYEHWVEENRNLGSARH